MAGQVSSAAAKKKSPASRKPASAPRFRTRDKDAVREYVDYLQGVLRVRDWTIDVQFTPSSEGSLADITAAPFQKWATLRVGPKFLTLDPRVQTQTLIHEVAHCVHFPLFDSMDAAMCSAVKKPATQQVLTCVLDGCVESITDHWADVLLEFVTPLELPSRN